MNRTYRRMLEQYHFKELSEEERDTVEAELSANGKLRLQYENLKESYRETCESNPIKSLTKMNAFMDTPVPAGETIKSKKKETRVSRWMLERYHFGELSGEKRDAVEAKLATDEKLFLHYERLKDSYKKVHESHPIESLAEINAFLAASENTSVATSKEEHAPQKPRKRGDLFRDRINKRKYFWGLGGWASGGLGVAAILLCVFSLSLYSYLKGRISDGVIQIASPPAYVSERSDETGESEPSTEPTASSDHFQATGQGTGSERQIVDSIPLRGSVESTSPIVSSSVASTEDMHSSDGRIEIALAPDYVYEKPGDLELIAEVLPSLDLADDSYDSDNEIDEYYRQLFQNPGPVVAARGGGTTAESPQQTDIAIAIGVTSIRDGEFRSRQLTSVNIPDGVTSIGGDAFANNRLRSISIPGSVTFIGSGAFRNNQLTGVVIPGSVNSIENSVFANNQLTTVTIPGGVRSIGVGAFRNNLLSSVIIPGSVSSIGFEAFYSNQLTSVTIGANVSIDNAIPGNFINAYTFHGKAAGTYTRPDTTSVVWTRR